MERSAKSNSCFGNSNILLYGRDSVHFGKTMNHFLKENNFDQIICILYNIPNHCSQNSHERLVMSPFFGEIQWLLPERNTKPDHQDWDMRHSCDNHIMSCEIRILMKLHCLLCRLEYVILLNKQKHFQID